MGTSPVDQAWTPLLNRVVSLTRPSAEGFNKSHPKRSTRFPIFLPVPTPLLASTPLRNGPPGGETPTRRRLSNEGTFARHAVISCHARLWYIDRLLGKLDMPYRLSAVPKNTYRRRLPGRFPGRNRVCFDGLVAWMWSAPATRPGVTAGPGLVYTVGQCACRRILPAEA
jgi:hypothetical protein